MTHDNTEDAREKLCGIMEAARIAMVTTVETDGSLRARPMAGRFLDGDRTHFHFLTGLTSHKAEEVMRDPRVNLTFATGGDYVSVSGTALISRDPALIDRLWSEAQRAWFPGGRTDPDVCAFVVELHYGEYWDPASSRVTAAYGWAKAMLTGQSADGDLGDRAKVGFAS